jgi:hypothetical protein
MVYPKLAADKGICFEPPVPAQIDSGAAPSFGDATCVESKRHVLNGAKIVPVIADFCIEPQRGSL